VQYLIDIRLDQTKRTYRIDADSEAQARERLLLRLPPHQRDSVIIDAVKIDRTTVGAEDPYGSFGGE
jgi:hypothetical protein